MRAKGIRWPPSFAALCWWCLIWFAICVGSDFLDVAASVTQAAGYEFGTCSDAPACYQIMLRAQTRGAWPACGRVWREVRGVLPFLPSEAVLGLPRGE